MEPERRLWDSELSALWVHCNRRVSLAGWVYYSTDGGQAVCDSARTESEGSTGQCCMPLGCPRGALRVSVRCG